VSSLRPTRLYLTAAVTLAALALGLTAPGARAKTVWVVKGHGFGHGVGMSQWGAYGFARHGYDYRQILGHYYSGTTIGAAGDRTVRVLLRSGVSSVRFRASSACGRSLSPRTVYTAQQRGGAVLLRRGRRTLAGCGSVLSTGGGTASLAGKGPYRGSLEIRIYGGGLTAVNVVPLESYVRGVIAKESPSSWPMDALEAQAIAARSYGIATARGGLFDQYDDTRSQVYGGMRAETARTNAAAGGTAGQVVLYRGNVAQTYFFSTSGGHTESNEFSSLGFGGTPIPYLRGVPDPFDWYSPYHRWKRKFSPRAMRSRLRGLVRGKLRKIRVLRAGASPRIVKAKVVGSRGSRKVSGPKLARRFALPDTWARFKRIRKK